MALDEDRTPPPPEGSSARPLGREQAEQLVVRVLQRHAAALLRTARLHSICADDAQEAYQRAMEIFLRRAATLDAEKAPSWLHTVVKHEAMAVRSQRQKHVSPADLDFETHEARNVPTADEQVARFDHLTRSAEALRRLKPNELRALWLQAAGQSYSEIAAAHGWTYTKVNRLLTEGRRAFLERYADIESGRECRRWMGVISALVDGEATPEQLVAARPHLRNCASCRATLRALHDADRALHVVLPGALAVAAGLGHHEAATGWVVRVWEAASGLHDRVAVVATRIPAGAESASAGKVAAVAASAAAVAGGGIAVVDRHSPPPKVAHHQQHAVRHAKAHSAAPQMINIVAQPARPPSSFVTAIQRTRTSSSSSHPAHPSHPAKMTSPSHHHTATAHKHQVHAEFGASTHHTKAAPVHVAAATSPAVSAEFPAPIVHVATPAKVTPPPVQTSSGVKNGGEFGP